ncbi:MAG: 50S ribosome-binding GTPase [Planctomycetaceae bacterium]|jgi:hypothetical protein|nr:50S ribosome-binding GTPase [Planctomycetaceae bacterium]
MSASNFIRVCVIGQSNAGKSSIIATLFGGIAEENKPVMSPIPGTQLKWGSYDDKPHAVSERILLRVHDSPGFQDSVSMLRTLQKEFQFEIDLEKITACSRREGFHPDDTAAWHIVGESDVILFVIKVNEDPEFAETAKCALKLLQHCGKPAIAVFNFLDAGSNTENSGYKEAWITVLKRYSIFWVSDYDAMHRDFAKEKELLERIRSIGKPTLNEPQLRNLDTAVSIRIERENRRIRAYRDQLAALIFGAASFRLEKKGIAKDALEAEKEPLLRALKENMMAASEYTKRSIFRLPENDSWGMKPDTLDFDRMASEDRRRIETSDIQQQTFSWRDYAKGGLMLTTGVAADFCGGMGVGTAAALAVIALFYGQDIVRETYNYRNKTYTLSASVNQAVLKELINIHLEFLTAIRTRGEANGGRLFDAADTGRSITGGNISRSIPESVRNMILRTIASYRVASDEPLTAILEKIPQNNRRKNACGKISECLKQGYPALFAEYKSGM